MNTFVILGCLAGLAVIAAEILVLAHLDRRGR